jgi:hypothetical protein
VDEVVGRFDPFERGPQRLGLEDVAFNDLSRACDACGDHVLSASEAAYTSPLLFEPTPESPPNVAGGARDEDETGHVDPNGRRAGI